MSQVRRIVQAADFQRLLGIPAQSRSAHFAVHHLAQGPAKRARAPGKAAEHDRIQVLSTELSTAPDRCRPVPVDGTPQALWLGYVVPKRHAKRAVTRSLLKRQIRTAFDRHAAGLPRGLWLVRLRQPFAATAFVSARSTALAAAARAELDGLLAAWQISETA